MTAVLLLLALCAAEAIGPPNGGQDSGPLRSAALGLTAHLIHASLLPGLQVTRENPTKADISPRSASFLEEEGPSNDMRSNGCLDLPSPCPRTGRNALLWSSVWPVQSTMCTDMLRPR